MINIKFLDIYSSKHIRTTIFSDEKAIFHIIHLHVKTTILIGCSGSTSNVDTTLTGLLSMQVTAVMGPFLLKIDLPLGSLLFAFLLYISFGKSRRPPFKVPQAKFLLQNNVSKSGNPVKKLSKCASCHLP